MLQFAGIIMKAGQFQSVYGETSPCLICYWYFRLTRLYLSRLGSEYEKPDYQGFLIPRIRCGQGPML